ncbi:hypothetical protein SUGI_0109140 [Cryptomeria japonica]|nr:hypothetical protein SUGI_0109140 [Cryptomeria japonica]
MMRRENEEAVSCARKRGRDDTHEQEKLEEQKKSRPNCFQSVLSTFEAFDVEDDSVSGIDEEHVYNLMKELMQEIGVVVDAPLSSPPALTLPLECSEDFRHVLSDSASSSNKCSSKLPEARDSLVSIEMCSSESLVDNGDYERSSILRDYDYEENFSAGGLLGNNGSFVGASSYSSSSMDIPYQLWQLEIDHPDRLERGFNEDNADVGENFEEEAAKFCWW